MISTTTDYIPGYEITEILDIVRGFSMRGFATILSSFTDPARLKTMCNDVLEIEHDAYADMVKHAEEIDADAIIAVNLSPNAFEYDNALKYQATVFGTAVKIKKIGE